jgi:hypothetical protein
MRPRDLESLLRDVHRIRSVDPADRARARDDLGRRLRARHAQLYPRQRWTIMKQTTWMRPLLASMAVLVLGVAACNTPTEYEVPVGQQLQFNVADPAKADAPESAVDPILEFCNGWDGVEGLSVNERIDGDGPLQIDVSVWGQALDGAALVAALEAEFPWLADADLTITPLTGTVEGNLGDRLGHALFDLEIDGGTAEEIRAQILAQLAAQGFEGDAVIDVQTGDGFQTIDVELTDDQDE